jgi:acid phosphatase
MTGGRRLKVLATGTTQRQRRTGAQTCAGLKRTLAIALGAVALAGTPNITGAADCPPETQVRVPQAPAPPLNIDKVKEVLLAYQAKDYDGDVAAVFAAARTYVERRGGEVSKPAIILDIDETSLSNWANIKANNFGFIREGACDVLPHGPCGFKAWILQGAAPVIMPALDLFNAAKAKGVAIFFITGRRDSERQATLWNLDRAGFEGWAKLITRPDEDSHATVEAFKSEERRKIAEAGYTIIATVGDQQSDLDGGFAECKFKVPNPFYFIR